MLRKEDSSPPFLDSSPAKEKEAPLARLRSRLVT
ncbi:hypothetical protein V6Z11_A07G030600 [Gossypium hirsutum]